MTRKARICGIQERTYALAMSQVRALVDRSGNHRRHVSQLQMFLVTEFLERGSLSAES